MLIFQSANRSHNIAEHKLCLICKMCCLQIGADTLRRSAVVLHENGPCSAPAERLNGNGTASRKEIQKPRIRESELEYVKQGLLNLISGRPGFQTFQCYQSQSACTAGDYSHALFMSPSEDVQIRL